MSRVCGLINNAMIFTMGVDVLSLKPNGIPYENVLVGMIENVKYVLVNLSCLSPVFFFKRVSDINMYIHKFSKHY